MEKKGKLIKIRRIDPLDGFDAVESEREVSCGFFLCLPDLSLRVLNFHRLSPSFRGSFGMWNDKDDTDSLRPPAVPQAAAKARVAFRSHEPVETMGQVRSVPLGCHRVQWPRIALVRSAERTQMLGIAANCHIFCRSLFWRSESDGGGAENA